MEESFSNHHVAISRIEDCEDNMNICKEDIDQSKIRLSSVNRDICMLEASMGSVHEQLEDLGDRMSGCFTKTRRVCTLTETHNRVLVLKRTAGQRPDRSFTCQIPYMVTLMQPLE